eukprot:CAMPEP_0196572234 /NCGR_PEP_ID=MMETSP1081-20130531/2305_1 /TAXON_ID=36882 /ORGANISM="Pyramimonas amylifera, Strain CCMP720" /LENGTH=880 /DNA_ID=CAMNT_0041889479 /DNA_START=135 /DNA_END=2777 /DNA_ORIENTATION=+
MAKSPILTWLFLGLVVLGISAVDLDTEQLEDNEEAQQDRDEPTADVVSQIVEQADDVDLQSGTGDISTTGDCNEDIERFCPDVKPGESRMSECLTNQLNDEESGKQADEGGKLSDKCKEEMRAFKAERSTNINLNIPLAASCKDDAAKYCSDSNLYPEPGAVITCLREVEEKLATGCKDEIMKTKIEASQDIAADAMLSELCTDDAEVLCEGVKAGGGRIQECLRKKRAQLSWDCQEELFRKEVEDADNLSLNAVLMRTCGKDKKKFCSDVKPGMGLAKKCLEDKRSDPDFSSECKVKFEEMMVRRASDFRLDANLREQCREDIEEVCGYEKDSLDTIAGYDGRVIECLQDYKDELIVPGCKEAVHAVTVRAGEDIRMDRPLADACYEDRKSLCSGVAPGSARVLRCLQDNRNQLAYECRATLFDQEVRLAEDIDFKYPMKKACTKETELFCKDIPHGHARVIKCLQEHDEDKEMSTECRAEVKRDEVREAEDYRLDYRLNKECDMEIDTLCADVCSPFQGQACGGSVVACLMEARENITSDSCKKELFSSEKRMGNDYRTDAQLKEACSEDVEKFCPTVEPGNGRVHQCLMENKKELSASCKSMEDKLQLVQADDVRLRPGFKACKEEIQVYCNNVKPGMGRLFRCLQANAEKSDVSETCKTQVLQKQGRMSTNWKMDFGVAHSCKGDVDKVCAKAKVEHGGAGVLKCLAENHDSLASSDCQNEVARATKMALWQYRKGAAMTEECDEDAQTLCPEVYPSDGSSVLKKIGNCLTEKVATITSGACKKMVEISITQEESADFEKSLASVTIMNELHKIDTTSTFVDPEEEGLHVLTLTGWVALASIAALVIVLVGGVVFAYRKFTGTDQGYTLVVKGGGV